MSHRPLTGMFKRAHPAITLLAMVAMWTTPAFAQTRDELWAQCIGDNPDLQIGGCTGFIQSGKEPVENLARAFNNRGSAYITKRQFDLAIKDLDQALKLEQNATRFYNRGRAYLQKKEYDRAIQDLDAAIRLDPNYTSAYNARGTAYASKGDHERGFRDLDYAIKLDSTYALAHYNKGNAYRKLGQHALALVSLNRGIALDSSEAGVFSVRGQVYVALKDYDRAIKDYDRALRMEPTATRYYGRGVAYLQKGVYEKAVDDFSNALRIKPDEAEIAEMRAIAHLHLKKTTLAMADCETAIGIDPKRALPYYVRGATKRATGDIAGGDADIATAKNLNATVAEHAAKYGVKP